MIIVETVKTRDIRKILSTRQETLVNAIVLIAIFIFMLSYFKPSLILLDTTTAGGDTATHTYPAKYLHEYLLPQGKIVGWSPGWYCGFPLFQFYFMLPFVMMEALALFMSIEVAFKIITVLGTFMMPLCALIAMKLMRFKFPIPALAAAFTLPFLFMEANSMWGGNIPSTLAGEFSYSLGFAVTLVFLGLLYRGINADKSDNGSHSRSKKYVLYNAVLFAVITLFHLYTMLLAGLTSIFFLFQKSTKNLIKNFLYFFKVYGLALMLAAFWLLPLIARLEYSTAYNHVWNISSWRKIFPDILMPFYPIAIISFVYAVLKRDKRIVFIAFSILAGTILFFSATKLGVVDIRFVPFVQFFPLLIAAYGIGRLFECVCDKIKVNKIKVARFLQIVLPIIALVVVIVWVDSHVTYIDFWIKWNYEGFENKVLWPAYSSVSQFLQGTANDPRVVYEHSPLHDAAGSSRAYENLPLFSGRSTLEGLYMQSIATSPFVFYIQSEVSKVSSCPFPGYRCTSMNVTRAAPHLRMFNVKHVIARTDEAIDAYNADTENYRHVKSIEPYEIFEVKGEYGYVVVPKYEPVFFETDDWKTTAYEWFKNEKALDVHLVFDSALKNKLLAAGDLNNLPMTKIEDNCLIEEHIYNEEIRFNTTCIGKPHIIKISYFPNWHVEGADRVYLVSPSFMLVYPEQRSVRLYYGKSLLDYGSEIISYSAVLIILFIIFSRNQKVKRLFSL